MKGKFKFHKYFLDTLAYYEEQGWKLVGITKMDVDGDFWFIMEKV